MVGAYINISTIHHDRGNKQKELEYLMKSMEIVEGMDDPNSVALMKYNLAVFYLEGGEKEKSFELCEEAFDTYLKHGDLFGQASIHTLWANAFQKELKYDSSLIELDKAIEIYQSIGAKSRVGLVLMNQAELLSLIGNDADALKKVSEAHKIYTEIGDVRFVAKTMIVQAKMLAKKKRFNEAEEKTLAAITIGEELGVKSDLVLWTKNLEEIRTLNGDYRGANEALLQHIMVKDELAAQNKLDVIAEMEARFQTEKKQLEIDKLQTQGEIQKLALEHEHNQRFWITIGLVLSLLLVTLVGIALFQKRRDNLLISKQKEEVESQNKLIEIQKNEVDEKNREITDSITYAKRIQEAILPSTEFWKSNLPDSFVLYRPKDIVAGDFYWIEKSGDKMLFAAADCTGHGVPGALVSVVCHNALNRAVREFELTDPADVLTKVRELVIETFESQRSDNTTIKDGMDLALCSLNTITKELVYAGANNPLWIISERELSLVKRAESETYNLFEIKPDKHAIGANDVLKPYQSNKIQLAPKDSIYIFSDGFQDQFGGPKGKKLKQVAFREMLLDIQDLTLNMQEEVLWDQLQKWKGDLEQVDDICVIGLKV